MSGAIAGCAMKKKEIVMQNVEEKEVVAANSMTTGWYVANRGAYIRCFA